MSYWHSVLLVVTGGLLLQAQELLVFRCDPQDRIYPDTPASGAVLKQLRSRLAQGETESLALCVHAKAAVAGVSLAASDLRGPRGARLDLTISAVEYVPLRLRGGGSRVSPLRLRPAGALTLPAGATQQFWITIHAPAQAPSGEYSGTIVVRPSKVKLNLRLTVLPFRLDPPGEPFFGIFLNPTYLPTLAELQDLRQRGFDALLWFWGHYGLKILNENGKLRVDFTDLDRFLERVKTAGMKGPVVLALGNDSVGHYERALAEAFGLALAPQQRGPKGRAPKVTGDLSDARFNALYVEGLRQLIEHGRAGRWPEIVLLPYDEPTEQLMEEFRHRCELIRNNLPGVRIYGVTMDRLAWAEQVAPHSDILVANGDFQQIGRLARDSRKGFWTYGSVAGRDSFGGARFRYGLAHWRHASQGIWFWGYNWYRGDPYDEFDAERGDSEWAIVYPPRAREGDRPIPTVAFEGMREGIDDLRYVATLERLIRDKPSGRARQIQDALEGLRGSWLSVSESQAIQEKRMDAFRSQVTEWILELAGARR